MFLKAVDKGYERVKIKRKLVRFRLRKIESEVTYRFNGIGSTKLDLLYANIAEGVLFVDELGTVQYVSPAMKKLLGYDPAQLTGKQLFEIIEIPASSDSFHDMSDLVGYCNSHQRKVKFRKADNSFRKLEVCFSIEEDETDGQEIYLLTLRSLPYQNEKIKGLKRREYSLKKSQEIAKVGHWEVDFITNITFWSDEIFRILGYEPAEVEPSLENYLAAIHPDDAGYVRQRIKQSEIDREPVSLTHRVIKGNEVKTILKESKLKEDADGNIISLFGVLYDITDLKKAEEKIFELSKFPEENPNPVLRIALNGELLYANKASGEILKVLSKDDGEHRQIPSKEFLSEILSSNKPVEKEYRIGEKYYALVFTHIKKTDYINIYGNDITERKKTESIIRENEQSLKKVFEMALIGSWKYDVVSDKYLFSDKAIEVIGFEKDNVPASSEEYFKLIHPDDLGMVEKEIEISYKTGEFYLEHRIIIDEKVKWVRVKSHYEYNEKGIVISATGIIQDITKIKKAEERLRKNEAQLTVAANIARLGYWELDIIKGEFTFSDQFYSIFKTTAADVGGYTMSPERYAELFLFPEDREILTNEIQFAIETTEAGVSRELEHRIRCANGEEGFVAVTFYVIKDKNGKTVKTFGANQDITEHKQHEAAIEKALEEKTTLLEEVHHRVKNNLAIVSGLLELQRQEIKDEALQYPLQQSIKRISSIALVHELIYQSDELSSVNIHTYLEKLVPMIKDTMVSEHKSITVDIDILDYKMNINQAIPLGLLLNELLTNSFKYAFPDQEEGEIYLKLKEKNGMLEFSYRDNGIGFKEGIDFNIPSNFGLTLIHSQLQQLEADYTAQTDNSFHLKFHFKDHTKGSHGLYNGKSVS